MLAVIYNSGLGKRMGELTQNNHKSMVKLYNGETIFERQIRILSNCGIKKFLITTGPFEEQLKNAAAKFPKLDFKFVKNPIYDRTNYIYSMYLAKEYFDDDVITLHGDLVFNEKLMKDFLADSRENIATVNRSKELPEKDFKARIVDGKIKEVGINIFDNNCFAFQPCYKLTKENINKWLDNVSKFINNGIDGVYAENAFNEISEEIPIEEFSYEDYFIDEVDNIDDLKRVSKQISEFDFKEQDVKVAEFSDVVNSLNSEKKALIVSNKRFNDSKLKELIDKLGIKYVLFSDFSPNPKYEELVKGISAFKENNCEYIISFGGGSAIDIAKCIKLYAFNKNSGDYFNDSKEYNNIEHICIPTTAGTGSESTRFAVIYKDGIKYSISHDSIIPNRVFLISDVLKTLPDYQKKSTLFDALCQAIESYWSVNSTMQSKKYASEAIKIILNKYKSYINNDEDSFESVLCASNLAGRAINISKTTAAHAMSYKITSLYGVSHGHAVSLCLPYIWEYMINNIDKCIDNRGEHYLINTFFELDNLFDCANSLDSINKFIAMFNEFELSRPSINNDYELEELVSSVNQERLKNNPVLLDENTIRKIYKKALRYNK